jgi:hypothetical protein
MSDREKEQETGFIIGSRTRILARDHNIDSWRATAFDFERLLEVFLQQNNTLAQRPNIVLL